MGIVPAAPFLDILSGAGLIAIGVLLFLHRREIGSLRGSASGSMHSSRGTTGLVIFALALMVMGCLALYRSFSGG
jgi:hypothetical protein